MSKKVKNEEAVNETAQTEQKTELVKTITAADAKAFTDAELQKEFEEHELTANTFGKLLQTKCYSVKVEDIKHAKDLLKHLEKNVRWTHADAPLFIAVYQKLKNAVAAGLNESNELVIDGPALNSLYQLLLKSEGVGYFSVRDYISLLTNIGEGISNGMRQLAEDQNTLKQVHVNLSAIDDELNARRLGIQVEAEDEVESEQA